MSDDQNLIVAEIPYMRRYALSLCRNRANADDIVQSALVRAIASFQKFERGTNLRAWLITIVYHLFIDGTRLQKRERENNVAATQRSVGMYTRPSQMASLQVRELQDAMNELPEEQRATLTLIALEDMSYMDAARITGVPIGTIRSRLSRARHALMQKLEGVSLGDLAPPSAIAKRKRVARAMPCMRNALPA